MTIMNSQQNNSSTSSAHRQNNFCFEATGSVAHTRIGPLLPTDWIDVTSTTSVTTTSLEGGGENNNNNNDDDNNNNDNTSGGGHNNNNNNNNNKTNITIPDFLWENTQSMKSKSYRDNVKAYSHLPNGICILDSKWVLGRVLSQQSKHLNLKKTEKEDEKDNDENDSSLLATLETHCFKGLDGFERFCKKVKMFHNIDRGDDGDGNNNNDDDDDDTINNNTEKVLKYTDILYDQDQDEEEDFIKNEGCDEFPNPPKNLWVIKDAMSNGAGGVWVVGPNNARSFMMEGTTPLYPEHLYVAQSYVWPPVLFDGRKCHVRVYGLLTCDNKAFVHKRAFLHVANDLFTTKDGSSNGGGGEYYQDSVHITNCCANSHDDTKFAGEILADLELTTIGTKVDGQDVIPLGKFMPSITASIATLAKNTLPFLQGGQANGGFEYMGIDFMLSYNRHNKKPIAYLLEVNAPPSQDTATGLPHAENLHDDVIRDLLTMWVIPKVSGLPSNPGGWRCVYHDDEKEKEKETTKAGGGDDDNNNGSSDTLIVPSKAAIINKIRWAMFEKRMSRAIKAEEAAKEAAVSGSETSENNNNKNGTLLDIKDGGDNTGRLEKMELSCEKIVQFARSQFPYFSAAAVVADDSTQTKQGNNNNGNHQVPVFFENAGGSQVAQHVIDAVTASLSFRHRSIVGTKTKESARETLRRILGTTTSTTSQSFSSNKKKKASIFMGPNASSLLSTLANIYVEFGLLTSEDEIVVSTENHLANYDPWIKAAKASGASIKYWTPFASTTMTEEEESSSSTLSSSSINLVDLVSKKTRIVAIPHASNILGQVRDIKKLTNLIKELSHGHAHVVVDGVATVPHWFADLDEQLSMVDWYVISCHKLFSSHLGGLYGRRNSNGPVELLLSAVSLSAGIPLLSAGCPSTGSSSSGNVDDDDDEILVKKMELGTVNYEACAGVGLGLGNYFLSLSQLLEDGSNNRHNQESEVCPENPILASGEECAETGSGDKGIANLLPADFEIVTKKDVERAYQCIRHVESFLVVSLLGGLRRSSKVRIIEGDTKRLDCIGRLPIASFVHSTIGVKKIASFCQQNGYLCRVSSFLCTDHLSKDLGFDYSEGVLRVSLAHYNSVQEVNGLIQTLELIPGWF